jgi:phage-related protein
MANTALPLSDRLSNNPKITRNERVKKSQLGDGYEAIAPRGKNWVFYTLEIQWEVLTYTELTTIKSAINTISPDGYFTYALPDDGVSRKWRLESFDYSLYSTYANATMKLREVFV